MHTLSEPRGAISMASQPRGAGAGPAAAPRPLPLFLLAMAMGGVAPAQAGGASSFHHTCERGTWFEARDRCAADGMQLATFCNQDQYTAAVGKVTDGCKDNGDTHFSMGCELPPDPIRIPAAAQQSPHCSRPRRGAAGCARHAPRWEAGSGANDNSGACATPVRCRRVAGAGHALTQALAVVVVCACAPACRRHAACCVLRVACACACAPLSVCACVRWWWCGLLQGLVSMTQTFSAAKQTSSNTKTFSAAAATKRMA